MDHLNILKELYHRGIYLNSKAAIPDDMEAFLKLNPLDQKIMNVIFENPNITIYTLTEILNKSKSTITSALNRLENKNLVKRKQSQEDKRMFNIILTDDGISLQKAHHSFEHILFTKILSAFEDNKETEVFLSLLEKIIKEFEISYERE